MELITAVRADDEALVKELIADLDTDVNATGIVEGTKVRKLVTRGATALRKSLPISGNLQVTLYETHALFEAVRGGNAFIVEELLSREDIDTAIHITTLADACNRSDVDMVRLLLGDPRTDPFAGSDEVPLPIQYAVQAGSLDIVRLFEEAGHITAEQEEVLLATARKHDREDIAAWLESHFLSQRHLEDLSPRDQVLKMWQEFQKQDLDHSMSIDKAELRVIAAALGTPLTEPELAEAQIALDTNGDGSVDFEELVAFWLGTGEEGVSDEVRQAVADVVSEAAAAKVAAGAVEGGLAPPPEAGEGKEAASVDL
ncbi:unnamed protein product [Symbiodinium sp. KB8]|nr:unnamed protein product [Symbiodinium sp. KB8]